MQKKEAGPSAPIRGQNWVQIKKETEPKFNYAFDAKKIENIVDLEFFAHAVQERLMEWGIKFQPIKPRSLHLNGKVQRTQRTDQAENYESSSAMKELKPCQ